MSLSDLASLGTFVSSIAVLVSLVYLAVQIRQAERNQRAIVQQARAARVMELNLRFAEYPIAEILAKGISGGGITTPEELDRFSSLFAAATYSMEDTFLHHLSGLVAQDEFEGFRARMKTVFGRIGFRTMWRRTRAFHGAGFRDFVDGVIRETPLPPAADAVAQWHEAVAAERAGSTR